jgi:polyhydroxyalkanoate synthesis repressor PhaR
MTKIVDNGRGSQGAGGPNGSTNGHAAATNGAAQPKSAASASAPASGGSNGGRPFVNGPAARSVERKEPVVIKKYANRRLYNTETSTYVTLDDLAAMVRNERDFLVYDAKTGDDLTHSVLTQIIVEQESQMEGGKTLLPIPFLRQLIRFYGGGIERMVPSYLQFSMEALVKEQERLHSQFSQAFTPQGALEVYQDQARRNLAVFEQAMAMFTPFNAGSGASGSPAAANAAPPPQGQPERPAATMAQRTQPAPTRTSEVQPDAAAQDELAEMKAQLAGMQVMIEKLSKRRK